MPGRVLAPSVMEVVLVAGAQRPKRSTQGPARCVQRSEKGLVAGRRMPVDLQGWRMTKSQEPVSPNRDVSWSGIIPLE